MSILTIIKKFQLRKGEIESTHEDRMIIAAQNIQNSQVTLASLRNYIESNEFNSVDEEIDFFKRLKQIPQEELILEVHIKSFLLNIPISNKCSKLKYCRKEMKRINNFFSEHRNFCQYVKTGRTDLDSNYYKRPSTLSVFEQTEPFFKDPFFYTLRDFTLSRINAFESYVLFLQDQHDHFIERNVYGTSKESQANAFAWTSNRTDLIELIYALYHSRTINNGTIDISQIAKAFESLFKIELGDVYKTYSDIKNRKRSRTKFLDSLSKMLELQITQAEL